MDKETHDQRWAAMVANWQGDPEFRSRMEEDPKAALAENGIELPGGVEDVRLAVNSEETVHMVFPPDPNSAMSDASLQDVVGGTGGWSGWISNSYYVFDSTQMDAGGRYSSCR